MPAVTLTLVQFGAIVAIAITLALLPGADLATLGLALAYRRTGVSPAYAEAVQDGDDVDPDADDNGVE